MKKSVTYKMILTAILAAIGVVGGSLFEFPVLGARVAPMQHLINLISGVLVGPWWAVTQAFITSLIRNVLGTGTVLAFQGSMIGAFCVGWLFQKTQSLIVAALGELIGTGVIGAIVAYPLAAWLMGTTGTVFLFIPSFFLSALVGVIVGYLILKSIWNRVIVPQQKKLGMKK